MFHAGQVGPKSSLAWSLKGVSGCCGLHSFPRVLGTAVASLQVVLPRLSDTKGYCNASELPAASKDSGHDLPVSTPRLFLATSQQAYKQRPPIEKLPMKRWTVRPSEASACVSH
ncbi:unnamed protein product [Symbiodinium natans]|uniref:Uncharacterized protein n=1 Tax=Symbiodinium natans TaxID=878477 RepID=A0A812UE11_9DINO|nr:unnamed protein product [Symbiodinium natans]